VKIEELTEYHGCLMNKENVWCIIKDRTTNYVKSLMKDIRLDGEPTYKFKSLPITKLRKHYVKLSSSYISSYCLIGNTVYSNRYLAEILSVIGKRNIELYQRQEENYPLVIKVNNTIVCLAPVILSDDDKKIIPKIEDII